MDRACSREVQLGIDRHCRSWLNESIINSKRSGHGSRSKVSERKDRLDADWCSSHPMNSNDGAVWKLIRSSLSAPGKHGGRR